MARRTGGSVVKIKSASSARQIAPRIAGAPGFPSLQFNWPRWRPPLFAKRGIRTLLKVDPSLGATQPEGANLTDTPGVITGDRGGFKGGVAMIHQVPAIPPKSGRNRRVVATPSPTSGAGVRSPYNQRSKVGRRGVSKRFGGGGGGAAPRSPGR